MESFVDVEGNIRLGLLLSRLWSKRWWIVATTMVVASSALAAAFLMTPMYRATTVLVPASSEGTGLGSLGAMLGQLGGLASLAGVDLGSASVNSEESLAVLRSREFTETFIRDNALMPRLFPDLWDAERNQWRGQQDDWPTLARAFRQFDEDIRTVNADSRTGLVRLQIVLDDREAAARWANELIERLNAEMRARAMARTNASVEYLEKELQTTANVETRLAIGRLMEAQINQRMLASVTREYAFRVVDRALPPDPRDIVRPKKATFLGLGVLLGLVCGSCLAFVASLRESRASRR